MTLRRATDTLLIHSTGTAPDVELTRRDIDRQHRARGLLGIGDHWIIERYGATERGRPENRVGLHCKLQGMNQRAISVRLVGGLWTPEGPLYTAAQWLSLRVLLKEIVGRWSSITTIGGPRDVLGSGADTSPGFDVADWLRREVPELARLEALEKIT